MPKLSDYISEISPIENYESLRLYFPKLSDWYIIRIRGDNKNMIKDAYKTIIELNNFWRALVLYV